MVNRKRRNLKYVYSCGKLKEKNVHRMSLKSYVNIKGVISDMSLFTDANSAWLRETHLFRKL